MSDEIVDFTTRADNSAALTALEQIAAAIQKLADKGQEMGHRGKEGADWASEGFAEMEGKLAGAVSMGEIASKVYEGLASALERVRDRAKEAADAQKEMAGNQAGWAEKLPTGTDPKSFGEALEKIAADTGNVPSDVNKAAAIALGSRTTQTSGDVLAAIAEAGKQSHDAAGIGQTAGNILRFKKVFPEASDAGAEAVIASHGASPDFMGRELEGLAMMRAAGGGKDSFDFLERLEAGMGPRGDPASIKALLNAAHRMGMPGSIVRGTMQQQFEWLQSAAGANTARGIFGGFLENPSAAEAAGNEGLVNDVASKIQLGRADPGVVRRLAEMVGGRGEAAEAMRRPVASFDDPATIAALLGQQNAREDLPAQQFGAVSRGASSALETYDLSSGASVTSEAQAINAARLKLVGWGPLAVTKGATELWNLLPQSPETAIGNTRFRLDQSMRDARANHDEAMLTALQKLADSNERLVKTLQDLRGPQHLKITNEGESADHNATTEAHAVGH